LGTIQRDGDLMTVSMGSPGGEDGPDACHQALGVRDNVAVETRTCEAPTLYNQSELWGRPQMGVPDAERLASAMLQKVRV
jgi:hypothetical protein